VRVVRDREVGSIVALVNLKMLHLPVPQKFNTFKTFTTFHNYHLASRAVGMPSVVPGNLHEGSHHVQLQNAMPRGHVFQSAPASLL